MNTTEITWKSSKQWGTVGLTHRADDVAVGDEAWRLVAEQPSKGSWVVRGWRDEDFAFYREGRTLADVKQQAAMFIGELRLALAKAEPECALPEFMDCGCDHVTGCQHPAESEPECWCETETCADGSIRRHEIAGCPEHCPYVDEDVCIMCSRVHCLPTCPEYQPPVVAESPDCTCQFRDISLGMRQRYGRDLCDVHREPPHLVPGLDLPFFVPVEEQQSVAEQAAQRVSDTWKAIHAAALSLAPAVRIATRNMQRAWWFALRPCTCPTPLHRMSCGKGATPKVV